MTMLLIPEQESFYHGFPIFSFNVAGWLAILRYVNNRFWIMKSTHIETCDFYNMWGINLNKAFWWNVVGEVHCQFLQCPNPPFSIVNPIRLGSQLGTHDEAFIWHHIYMTEQSHDSFTWRLKSMTYRYMTINYMKSSYMTLYLHEQHLHDGSLVWNPLIWLNYSFTWQMFTWQTLTWRFPSITWHSFA